MPAKSQAQRALLNARFGHDWVVRHHYDNSGKLPSHVTSKRKRVGADKQANPLKRKRAMYG
jgi:hypothetical protein